MNNATFGARAAVTLEPLDKAGIAWAQTKVQRWHYLHARAHQMSCVDGYAVHVAELGRVGCLLLGRRYRAARAVEQLTFI